MSHTPRKICFIAMAFAASSFERAYATGFSVPVVSNNTASIAMGYGCVADGTMFYSAGCNPALLSLSPSKFELGVGAGISPELFTAFQYFKKNKSEVSNIYKDLRNGLDSNDSGKIAAARDTIKKTMDIVAGKPFGLNAQPYASIRFSDRFGMSFYNNTNIFIQIEKGRLVDDILGLPSYIDINDPATKKKVQDAVDNLKSALKPLVESLPGGTDLLAGTINIETFLEGLPPMDKDYVKKQIAYQLSDYLPSVMAIAYSDSVLAGTYSFDPLESLPHLTMGTNLRLVNRRITLQFLSPLDINSDTSKNIIKELRKSSTRLGADLGLTYYWSRPYNLRVGLIFQDLLHGKGVVQGEGADSLLQYFSPTDPGPLVINSGVSWYPSSKWRVNLDLYDILTRTILYEGENYFTHVNMGAQYSLFPWLGIRGGVSYRLATGGVGFMFKNFNLDYAFAPNVFGIYSHFIQFRFLFGTSKNKSKGNHRIDTASTQVDTETKPSPVLEHSLLMELPDKDANVPATLPEETNTYQGYLKSADSYISQKDYRNAAKEYNKAQKALSKNDKRRVFAYEQQGQMSLKLKNISKARDFFLAAIQTAKKFTVTNVSVVNAYLGLAYCFEKSANRQAALKNYEKALTLSENEKTKSRIKRMVQRLKMDSAETGSDDILMQ